MAEIVGGDAAHVHSHFGFHFGFEELFCFTHGVVQPYLRRRFLQGETLGAGFAAILLRRERRRRAGAEGRRALLPEDGGVGCGWSGARKKRREEGSVALKKRDGTHFCSFSFALSLI